jgi:segregation and condensation protein B
MSEPVDVLEALLFASDAPVEAERIQEVLELESAPAARELVDALRQRLDAQDRALQIIEVGGGFRLVTRPEMAPWLIKLQRSKTRSRLSRPALETLAIIAYRQPVSRPEVDAVRGVNSEGVLDSLLDRRLVRIAGRKDTAGRPFLYETTREFLVAFGLRDLSDLPKVEGELIVPEVSGATSDAAPGDGSPADGDGGAVEAGDQPADAREEDVTAAAPASSRETDTGELTTAADPAQQDPGPRGPDVAPRS